MFASQAVTPEVAGTESRSSQDLFQVMLREAGLGRESAIDAFAAELANPSQLAAHLIGGLDGLGKRVKELSALASSPFVTAAAEPSPFRFGGPPQPETGLAGQAADLGGEQAEALRLYVRVFDLAIEVNLLMNAATKLSSTVQTLLRAQ